MEKDEQIRELQNVFVQEADSILIEAEETLMELEKKGFEAELVNKAFRLAHNFKGSARSVGFAELGELAHKYEDVLSAIKGRILELSPEAITALLKVNDALKSAIHGFSSTGHLAFDPGSNIKMLEEFLEPRISTTVIDELGYGVFDETKDHSVILEEKKANEIIKSKSNNSSRANDLHDESTKQNKSSNSQDFHRVSSDRLKYLFDVIGEVVVNQAILDDCARRDDMGSEVAQQALSYMSKRVNDLQNIALSMRLVPIKPLFQKLRRTVRDVSESLRKEVKFTDEGDHCELDKSIADKITDPLNHMIRNAIDHGVDTNEERIAAGKSPVAQVNFSVQVLDEHVKIIISDDGRGLDRTKIVKKALSSGLIKNPENMSDDEIYRLIFAPGFSTKEQVTDVSGRGVGMEVVQKTVEELKGSIGIVSKLGIGTTFEINLPLSLSIIAGIVVSVSGNPYVIPVSQLVETIEINKHKVENINSQAKVINIRGEIMPVFDLTQILSTGIKKPTNVEQIDRPKTGLVTYSKGRKIALEVDAIINQQKVVLKELGRELSGMPGIVAGAVLRNGEPSLVISPDKFIIK